MPKLNDSFMQSKLLRGANDHKKLISLIKGVIRQKQKIQKQINRKYESYKQLDAFKEELKKRLIPLTSKVG